MVFHVYHVTQSHSAVFSTVYICTIHIVSYIIDIWDNIQLCLLLKMRDTDISVLSCGVFRAGFLIERR